MKTGDQGETVNLSRSWLATGTSILNGMFGDYLHRRRNGLAIDMAFMHQESPIELDADHLREAYPQATGKIVILIHGLCCNEGSFRLRGDTLGDDSSYGLMLQKDLGFTPFYVRYNTGLPIADNGAHFSALIHDLLAAYPVPVDEIVLIGHSMGGLVTRSACEVGTQQLEPWVDKVSKAFYLGTPHEGADLEKFAHLANVTLNVIPNPITNVIGDVLNLRSQGIKDLRHGGPLEAGKPNRNTRKEQGTIPWLGHAQHFLIAGTLTEDPQHLVTLIFGDALVKPPRGNSDKNSRTAQFPSDHIKIFNNVHHMALAHDPMVYQQIRQWCAATRSGAK